MNKNNSTKLIKELEQSGASKKESQELSLLSKNLSNLYNFERSDELKSKFLYGKSSDNSRKMLYVSRRVFLTTLFSISLLLGYVSIVHAQKSLPGDPLYLVKRLSERAAVLANPSFNSEVLQRRSEEIKSLSLSNRLTDLNQAIKDYEKNLDENDKFNSEKMKNSKRNLEEARDGSGKDYREAIQNAINQTEKKQNSINLNNVKGNSTHSDQPGKRKGN